MVTAASALASLALLLPTAASALDDDFDKTASGQNVAKVAPPKTRLLPRRAKPPKAPVVIQERATAREAKPVVAKAVEPVRGCRAAAPTAAGGGQWVHSRDYGWVWSPNGFRTARPAPRPAGYFPPPVFPVANRPAYVPPPYAYAVYGRGHPYRYAPYYGFRGGYGYRGWRY